MTSRKRYSSIDRITKCNKLGLSGAVHLIAVTCPHLITAKSSYNNDFVHAKDNFMHALDDGRMILPLWARAG